MLKRISISDFVIFTNLSVDFTEGLTALTGETGAGKSILLDAMGLVLGDEPDREAIRQGAQESAIEAIFEPPQSHPIWGFLAKQDGVKISGSELRIKRVTGQGSKDEITINGTVVTLPFLKELGTFLIEIHGQNANQNFLGADNQLLLLDAFGDFPPHIIENVASAWEGIKRVSKELEEEQTFFAIAEREKLGLERIVASCEKIGMKKGLYQELKAEHAHLVSSRDI